MNRTKTEFRVASEADVAAIVELLRDDHLGRQRETEDMAPYMRAFAAISANENQMLVVGTLDGQVVATAQLGFLPGLSHRGALRCDMEAVRVASDLRGTGVGTDMCHWILEEARRRGCAMVQLSSHASRTDAQRFYARLGFEATHTGMKLALGSTNEQPADSD